MTRPSHEDIALRAYCRWSELGWPHGQDIAIWLQAEQQLTDEMQRRNIMGQPKGTPDSQGFVGEKKLTLKAKTIVNFAGVTYQPGDTFQLPEREALGVIGTGAADEIAGDAPAPPES